MFSDGSLLAGGNVGGGAFVVKEGGAEDDVECGIWGVATVWDGEVAGMVEGLARTQRERKIQILAHLNEAIAAVRKAGRTGKARLSHLKKVVNDIGARIPRMVKLGWAKAHMGILGNQAADVVAKNAVEGVLPDYNGQWMSGGGDKTVGKAEEEGKCGGRRG